MKTLVFRTGIYTPVAFTDGKEYPVVREQGRGVIVKNDNGHDRFVVPGESHGHCVNLGFAKDGDRFLTGYFEEVA